MLARSIGPRTPSTLGRRPRAPSKRASTAMDGARMREQGASARGDRGSQLSRRESKPTQSKAREAQAERERERESCLLYTSPSPRD
eukprot:5702426-Alexandrium_andersonii.AAC.1